MITKEEKQLALIGYATALLLYIHLILFVAALIGVILYNSGKGNTFASFHLRQMTGIGLIALLVNAFASAVPNVFIALLLITLMNVLAGLGFLSANQNQQTPLPFIGRYFQEFFSFIK
jgi:hypothetical protein